MAKTGVALSPETNSPQSDAIETERVAAELVDLKDRADRARAILGHLEEDLLAAKTRSGSRQTIQLIEANEQLVVASLRAQADAEGAARALRELSRSAERDPLTGLPNRLLLLDRLAQAIANAKRSDGHVALLFVDLDNFKHINDTLGHNVGDQVLKAVAHRLVSALRVVDTVSRHGGDEFLVILGKVSEAADATVAADKVLKALQAPIWIANQVLHITASIGISVYPQDGDDIEVLIDRADTAMYRAKRSGSSSTVYCADDTAEPATARQPQPEPERSDLEQRYLHVREANEQLIVAALTAKEMFAAGEQAQRKQIEFLAMLAHELRNPLTPIQNAASIIGRSNIGESLLLQMREVIEEQVGYMSRLLDDLLDVSRARTGKLRLQRRAVDLSALLEQVVASFQAKLEKSGKHVEMHLPVLPLTVYGDPLRLNQIFTNLVNNASKFTPSGGNVIVTGTIDSEAVHVTVADSGIGIQPDVLPYIFEPFMQGNQETEVNGEGLGIGLMVVRELVEAHGGTVSATSAGTGLGSQFFIDFPLLARSLADLTFVSQGQS